MRAGGGGRRWPRQRCCKAGEGARGGWAVSWRSGGMRRFQFIGRARRRRGGRGGGVGWRARRSSLMAVGPVVVLRDVGRWRVACEATAGGRGRAARTREWGRGGASGAAAANGGAPCARLALLRRRARGARRPRGCDTRRGRCGEQRPQAGEAAPREGLGAGGQRAELCSCSAREERRRREKEEREGGEKEKRKRKKEKKKRKEREGKRELPARFAAAVGHACAARLRREATRT